MKSSIALLVLLSICATTFAQEKQPKKNYAEFTAGAGSYRGSFSLSYLRNWRFGHRNQFAVGLGARATSFVGVNQYYITAPAELTSESSSPFIIFKENVEANIDSLLIKSPQVHSLNLMINLDYRISQKLTGGFNIDFIGFSFGGSQRANYINGITGKNTSGTPTSFNILLISDNDRGSLNSEFYLRYLVNEKWSVKFAAQFLFTEYTTKIKVQERPEPNDRFRNKSLLGALGIAYNF